MEATDPARCHEVLIVGAGFGGIGMAIRLRQEGIDDFLILERGAGVGGVWRDNTYPGAACDVPSHLYSFSFAPNPAWSRHFASQGEILDYLRHCADQHGLGARLRCQAEVVAADFDERHSLWRVRLADGSALAARTLVMATGQLSNPVLPDIDGIASFGGPSFHSARWNHGLALAGKRVAVIGSGASATQLVPALAPVVGSLTVFQRSPAWIIPRPDHAYPAWRRTLFAAMPWTMRLHRALIYARYESRALAFTRARWILQVAAGRPFRRMLARQVADPALRARLTPAYPVGCKRVLLSSDYLATLGRANVALVGERIARIRPDGIETADGRLHQADVIVHASGFAASRFLAPIRIGGRGGIDLNAAWAGGAAAYLGMTVPGFPNFYMLYGPNTNLGHSSIVIMLESQIAHVLRCLRAQRQAGAVQLEVQAAPYRAFEAAVQARLAGSAWTGCTSWYLDQRGRNTVNWPGFTFSYRWLARHARLSAYRFSRPGAAAGECTVLPPPSRLERLLASQNRLLLRAVFRPLVGPPLGLRAQRRVVDLLGWLMPAARKVGRARRELGGVPAALAQGNAGAGAILYLHGGAFCLGSSWSHRGLSTRLARASGLPVWTPDYRLAPEHPYPAALDDAMACYQALLASGLRPRQIVLAGDSAGAALALGLMLRLRMRGDEMPAGAALLSPAADLGLTDPDLEARAGQDPMLRGAWLRQAFAAYACPPDAPEHRPLAASLAGLPPLLIQVGSDEIVLGDALRLARHARAGGVECRLEIFEQRWHVFQLQAAQLASARGAIDTIGEFARRRVGGEGSPAQAVPRAGQEGSAAARATLE